MALVYTTNFAEGRYNTSGIQNAYEVPAGKVAVVRNILVYKRNTPENSTVQVGRRVTAAANVDNFFGANPVVGAYAELGGQRVVLDAGEFLVLTIGAANQYVCWVSGYLFDTQ